MPLFNLTPALPDGGLGPIPAGDLGFDPLSIAFWIGLAAPFIVALAEWAGWSKTVKFWVAVTVSLILAVFAWWTTAYPAQWELIATQFAIIFTTCQTLFYLLKPTGILDWITDATSPGYQPKHAAEED